MTAVRIGAFAIAVASLALGIATFPRAFEPGRAEADGPLTAFLSDDRVDPNTWVPLVQGGEVEPKRGAIAVRATGAGLMLLSRTLAVFPRRCYLFEVVGAAREAGVVVDLRDEHARTTLRSLAVPVGGDVRAARLLLDSGEHRRVSLAITADRATRATIRSATLRRSNGPCERVRSRRPERP